MVSLASSSPQKPLVLTQFWFIDLLIRHQTFNSLLIFTDRLKKLITWIDFLLLKEWKVIAFFAFQAIKVEVFYWFFNLIDDQLLLNLPVWELIYYFPICFQILDYWFIWLAFLGQVTSIGTTILIFGRLIVSPWAQHALWRCRIALLVLFARFFSAF